MNTSDVTIGEVYLTRIGANLGRVQVQAVHTDGKRFVVARPDQTTRITRTMLRSARALHPVVKPGAPAPAAPVRRDNRGGYRPSNPGGRPTHASRGLELRNQPVTLKFTESELAAIVERAEAEADGAELSVWLRDILLGMIGG